MIGYVETISNEEREQLSKQFIRTEPEDLNNTLEIEE